MEYKNDRRDKEVKRERMSEGKIQRNKKKQNLRRETRMKKSLKLTRY